MDTPCGGTCYHTLATIFASCTEKQAHPTCQKEEEEMTPMLPPARINDVASFSSLWNSVWNPAMDITRIRGTYSRITASFQGEQLEWARTQSPARTSSQVRTQMVGWKYPAVGLSHPNLSESYWWCCTESEYFNKNITPYNQEPFNNISVHPEQQCWPEKASCERHRPFGLPSLGLYFLEVYERKMRITNMTPEATINSRKHF